MRKISAILLKKGVFEPMKKILTTAVLLTALVSCGRTTNTDNQPMSDTSGYSSNDISPTDRDDKIDRYDADHDKSITDDDIDRADHDSRDNTITDHAKDAVDGAENAGEDIIDSVGEAGKDIIDGVDGDISSDTSAADTQTDTDVNTTAQVDTLTSE